MRLDGMSPKERVFASPDIRSSPNESVMKDAACRRRRAASDGEDGWWVVVRGTARPSEVRERRTRVSPQWAVRSVDGVEGCQNGVGVGVEIRATDAVEPPLNGVRDEFELCDWR